MSAQRLTVDQAAGSIRIEEPVGPARGPALSATDRWRAYLALTKPRIVELLLVTTVPAMIVAQGGMPPLILVLTTLLGGTLGAAGANAINCYIDRDIDEIMPRTR